MARYNPAMVSAAAGEISPRLEGRDNLEQYFESLRECENFVVTTQGGLLRRSGTLRQDTLDVSDNYRLATFVPAVGSAYLVLFGDETITLYENGLTPLAPFAAPYTASELDEVRVAQEASRLYIVHPNHPVYVISPGTLGAPVLQELTYRRGRAPMLPPNEEDTVTFEVTGAGPTFYTLTVVNFRDLTSEDIGRYVRIGNGTDTQVFYKITAVGSTTTATIERLSNLSPPAGPQSDWSISPITDAKGFYTVAFHEGRLFYGGTPEAVDRVWGSNSDDFDFFNPIGPDLADRGSDLPDRSFSRRLVSGQVNLIRWMLSTTRALHIGTVSAEFSMEPDGDSILSNTSARVYPTTSVGSAPVEPAIADSAAVFIQKDGEKLRRVEYSLAEDRDVAQDLSVLAEHATRAKVFQMAYQQSPDSILWMALADGGLVGVTLETRQRVIAFHQHRLGGHYQGGAPFVISLAVLPQEQRDDLFMVVKRTAADGSTRVTLERLAPSFRPALKRRASEVDRVIALKDAHFADQGRVFNSSFAVSNITAASPAVVTAAPPTLTTGDRVKLRGFPSMPSLNNKVFTITVTGGTTFELDGSDTTGEVFYPTGEALLGFDALGENDDLIGEEVVVLADGAPIYGLTPNEFGIITFPDIVFEVSFGLPFISRAETQRLTGGSRLGTAQSLPARTNRVDVRVLDTVGLSIHAANVDSPDEAQFRPTDYFMDEALPLFSGDVSVSPESEWTDTPTVTLIQAAPLPAHILSVYPRNTSNDR